MSIKVFITIFIILFFIHCGSVYDKNLMREVSESNPDHSLIFISPGFTCTSSNSIRPLINSPSKYRSIAPFILIVTPGEQTFSWIYQWDTNEWLSNTHKDGRGKLFENIKPRTSYYLVYENKRVRIYELTKPPFSPM